MIPPDYQQIHREVDRVAQLLRTEFDDDEMSPHETASQWPRSTRWWIVGSFIAGVTLGIAIGAHPASSGELAPSYLGIQGGPSWALNSTQDDRYEARSQAAPTIAAFAGWRTRFDWLDVQLTGRWLHQEAHGLNRGSMQESVDGDMDAGMLTIGPVVKWPGLQVTPYARLGIGPAYRDIDMSTSSQTRTQVQRSGAVLALEGAAGLERRIDERFSVRFEGGCQYADPMQSCGANVALVIGLNGG